MANSVEITLTARDNASATVEKVGTAVERLGASHGTAAGEVRRLATVFARVLDPALGGSTRSLGLAGEALGKLASGGGIATTAITLTAAAVAAATLGLNRYVDVLSRVETEQGRTALALRAMDFEGLGARATALTAQLEDLRHTFSLFGALRNVVSTSLDAVGSSLDRAAGSLSRFLRLGQSLTPLGDFFRKYGTDTESIAITAAARDQANAAAARLAPRQTEIARTTFGAAQQGAAQDFALLASREAALTLEAEAYHRSVAGIAQALSNQLTLQEKLLGFEQDKALAAATARGAKEAELEQIRTEFGLRKETLGLTAKFAELEQREREGTRQIRTEVAQQELGLANLLIAIEEKRVGLSKEEQESLAVQVSLMKEAAQVAVLRKQIDGLPESERRTLLEEQVRRTQQLAAAEREQLTYVHAIRVDAVSGFAAGLREMADEFGSTGAGMQAVARETAMSMQRAFSDQFFDVITGNFKDLPNVAKQFTSAMLRTITDELARFSTGSFLNLFRGLFQGGLGAAIPGAGGLGGGGGGGGGGLVNLFQQGSGGGPFASSVSGSAAVPGGGFSFSNLPTPPLSSFGSSLMPSSVQALLNFPLVGIGSDFVALSGGQVISSASELALAGVESSGIAGSSAAISAGATVGTALGGIAAGAALAFTIYSGLQGAPTAANITTGAITGMIAGGVLGTLINFPIGTIVGALAGGLLGGGSAALGKGGAVKKESPNERSARVAQIAAGNLSAAIDAASTLEELRGILNMRWSPYNEVNIVAYARAGTHWMGAWTNGPSTILALVKGNGEALTPFPPLEIMLDDPRYIDNLEIQVGAGGSAVYNQALTEKFQAKWRAILAKMAQGVFGFTENLDRAFNLVPDTGPGLAAVERFSALSGDRLREAKGQQLSVSPDVLIRAGLSMDEVEQFLRIALQVDKDRSLNILVKPEVFQFG